MVHFEQGVCWKTHLLLFAEIHKHLFDLKQRRQCSVPCAQCLVCFSPRLREQHLCSVPADKEADPQLAALHPSLHCNGVRDWEQHSGRSSGNKKIPAVPWPLRQHPVLVPPVWAGRDPPVLLQVSLPYPEMHSRKETLVMLEVSFTRIVLCNTFHCFTNAACSGDCLWVS